MKALSLWQPWASAIALGHKTIETRSWSTKYRGPIAIHAAKRWTPEQIRFASIEHALNRMPKRLPLGAIVAVARLARVERTDDIETSVSPIERIYGDYSWGRYGWVLEDIKPLREPISFRGAQGLFNVPDDLLVGA